MNSQELLAKFVFWTQAWLGVIQVVTFFISGAGVYVAIVLHDNWVSRDFTCSNASDHDKNRCMVAYKTMELYPLQFGLMVPSLWYCGSLVIWIISGIVIQRWFKKFVDCETRQRHQGCFKKFHIGVVYFLGIVVRLVYFLAMCAVYLSYHNNWVVSSNYVCKLSPKIYISCFYSKAKERTALNKASFGIIVSFLILAFLELLYLCRDNYRHKYEPKDTREEALRCEECAYFANRHLIWLKPESEDAKNDQERQLIDPEETAEVRGTASDGPQQPERNYNPPEEEKPEKDVTGASEGVDQMYCPPSDSSDPPYVDDCTTNVDQQSVGEDQTDPIPNIRFPGAHLNPDDHLDGSPGSSNQGHSSSDTSSNSTSDADSIKSGLDAATQAESRTDLLNDGQGSYRQDGGQKGIKDQGNEENVRPSNNSMSENNSKKEGQSKSGKAIEKVDGKTLNYVAEQIASGWKKLGIELEVPYHVIEQIEYDNRKCYDQAYEMLRYWLKRKGDDATRHELNIALKGCERKDIADNMP